MHAEDCNAAARAQQLWCGRAILCSYFRHAGSKQDLMEQHLALASKAIPGLSAGHCLESHGAAQGIRPARQTDVAAIQELLTPLEQAGITKKRTRRDLYADLQHFTVVERESKVGLT